MTLKERVRGRVKFQYLRDSALWYATDDGYLFPVPLSDTGNEQGGSATFLAEDKGVIFMRWISRAMKAEEKLRSEKENREDAP